jgi:environmental stress-induced protein Ves
MEYEIIRKEEIITASWSGGKTSELYIYPPESNYKERNFGFRISTATVEIEKSDFTSLNNVYRTLMVLDGEMALSHKNEHSVLLKKFDQDCFEGGWKTTSVGKCEDFNLMCQNDYKGTVEQLKSKENFHLEAKYSHYIFYVYKGSLHIELKGESISTEQGDVLILKAPFHKSIRCNIIANGESICCKTYTNKE